jgi:hypothetical protein
MAKIASNEYVKIAWVLDANMTPAQAAAPTDTILNAGTTLQLSPAIAWQDFALGATDSDDVEDRGITDPGNAITRGFANFEGTLSFFRDKNSADTNSDFVKAFQAFRTPRTYGYMVMRVAEKKWSDAWAAGDRVSVFRFVADIITDDATGDDSVKFTVTFLPQGLLYPYTVVKNGTTPAAIAGVATTKSQTVAAGPYALVPTLDGKDIRATATYSSSDTTKATVSANGVVKPIAAGTATITVNHPAATAAVTQALTLT